MAMKIRKLIFDDEKPTRKNVGDLQAQRDESNDDGYEPIEPWYPPSAYWRYWDPPTITRAEFLKLPNNIRTGIANYRTREINQMGRRLNFSDTSYEHPGIYVTNKWHCYKQDQQIYQYYLVAAANQINRLHTGGEFIDPQERNQMWFVSEGWIWYWDPSTKDFEHYRGTFIQNGGLTGEAVQILPATVQIGNYWSPLSYYDPKDRNGKTRTIKSKRF
jgi:hypothetical protein